MHRLNDSSPLSPVHRRAMSIRIVRRIWQALRRLPCPIVLKPRHPFVVLRTPVTDLFVVDSVAVASGCALNNTLTTFQ